MGTENQLMEDRPGHNNYRLDAIVAQVWQREEHSDNAETKYQEAIRDMASIRFPGEEERLIALAGLYASLADVYRDKSQFEDAITYHRAAEALGGPGFTNSSLVCYCFYRMKEFDSAFAECDAVYKRSADLDALYWRAKTQEKFKHTGAAIADYTVIADSEDGWRTTAVITLSVLVNDPRRELEIFEKYPYVFDEEERSKGDLAVVYNNRCYAYKQLGQLDKALEDCNTSLKFGNIPDALAKKRDIEKRLKAQKKRA